MRIGDFEGDAFDHTDLPFLGGGSVSTSAGGNQPIAGFGQVPSSVRRLWGSQWKKVAIEYYDRVGSVSFTGEHIAYKTNFMDLDPVYKDRFGDPLLRLTIDWNDNERKMVEYMTPKLVEIAHAMGATEVSRRNRSGITRRRATRPRTCRVARSWRRLRTKESLIRTCSIGDTQISSCWEALPFRSRVPQIPPQLFSPLLPERPMP